MPANAVSELMMVPIGLQLMLCPPKDEGHIPPVSCGPPFCDIFPKERYVVASESQIDSSQ